MLGGVDGALVTIGEFSKMTYLSVKALRHYHDVGLLVPAAIDVSSGYRHYSTEQVATAQAIRRFRDLDMPIDDVRAVIEAPDDSARNAVILAHLDRMQRQLERTETTVASLQALLTEPTPPAVELRRLDAVRVLAITETVEFDASEGWCEAVFAELHATLDAVAAAPAGPDAALYADAFFEERVGPVTAFVAVGDDVDGASLPAGAARARLVELAALDVAVVVHDGPFADLDRAYGALGTEVARRGIAAPGPVREHYLTDTTTEVCWPVSR
jgi:DNA-binding transcriptional MerR regulator